jgi:hypothetical protein
METKAAMVELVIIIKSNNYMNFFIKKGGLMDDAFDYI